MQSVPPEELKAHVLRLAAKHGVTVEFVPNLVEKCSCSNPKCGLRIAGTSFGDNRRIATPEIKGPISYAVAMHELGHQVGPQARFSAGNFSEYRAITGKKLRWDNDLTMIEELNAWDWAVRNALMFTEPMKRLYRYVIKSYAFPMEAPLEDKLGQLDNPTRPPQIKAGRMPAIDQRQSRSDNSLRTLAMLLEGLPV